MVITLEAKSTTLSWVSWIALRVAKGRERWVEVALGNLCYGPAHILILLIWKGGGENSEWLYVQR